MKVVINRGYGGFSISLEAVKFMANLGDARAVVILQEYESDLKAFNQLKETGVSPEHVPDFTKAMYEIYIKHGQSLPFHGYGYTESMDGGFERDGKALVAAVEELGDKADGSCAKLAVVEIPDGIDWRISDYDGYETIEEEHRSWS